MHDQPNAGPQAPAPGTREYEVERTVLLELVLAPPPHTDDIAELTVRIGEPRADVDAALAALAEAGLAARDERVAWASPAARYCEALYRLCT
jgi:predicted transcriptional regulator